MRTRRIPRIVLAVATIAVLAGCTSIGAFTSGTTVAEGNCLENVIGADADLTSIVPCTEPHLYDVVAVSTWPGMTNALKDMDPADLHHRLQIGGTDLANEYWDWSAEYCSTALRSAVGWTGSRLGVSNDDDEPLTSDGIWAMPGGSYEVDISLSDEDAFAAGDHRTACSAAWVDASGHSREVALPAGMTFADLFDDRMPSETRQCIDSDGLVVECTVAGSAEVTAQFDAVAASSEDLVVEYATTEDDDTANEDLARLDDICYAITEKLPHREGNDETISWVIWDGDWGRVYGTKGLQVGVRYFAQCFAYDPALLGDDTDA